MNTQQVTENKSYKVEIKLKIEGPTREYPYTKTVAEVDMSKSICCPGTAVREEATKLLRNAVANFSESAAQGLKPIIDAEPKIEGGEEAPFELSV